MASKPKAKKVASPKDERPAETDPERITWLVDLPTGARSHPPEGFPR